MPMAPVAINLDALADVLQGIVMHVLPRVNPQAPATLWQAEEFAPGASPGLSPRALARVQAYISAHLSERLGLSDLAAAACMSRFHFARQFRASTGRSPMEYVQLQRIEAARAMLDSGAQKIAATAAALGFFDQSHFTRTFRRLIGLSPSAYSARRLLRRA